MAGGIAGFYSNGTISDCYTIGNVYIINNNTQYYAGGIVGMAEGLNLSSSYSVCSVSTGGYDYSFSGGLLGTMNETIVSKCFFDGSVNASPNCYLGYVAAYTVSGKIDNCFISENVKVLRNGTEFTYGWDSVKIKKVDMETLLTFLSNNWNLSIWEIENNAYPTLK